MEFTNEKDNGGIKTVTSLKLFDTIMLPNGKCYTVANVDVDERTPPEAKLGCKEATLVDLPPVLEFMSIIDFYGGKYKVTGINTTGWTSEVKLTLKGLR